MKVTSCVGPSCGRPYQINRFSDTTIWVEPGKITCPHCGTVTEGEANAVFMTHALSAAEEAGFSASSEGAGSAEDTPAAAGEPPQE